jgi:hypothetical protein
MTGEYDFFIAHAAADTEAAERLYDLLCVTCRVFLDSRCLELGDEWDQALAAAQRRSKVTVVLVSSRTERAFYQREEIAAAIDLARKDPESHRVVPIYLHGPPDEVGEVPYGLRLKQGMVIQGKTTVAAAARRLLDLRHRRAEPNAAMKSAVTVLHLSDTRCGAHRRLNATAITADLARVRESHGLQPDLIVVAGDLTESGMRSEFEEALRFLEQLSMYLDVPRRHVVIVPGVTMSIARRARRTSASAMPMRRIRSRPTGPNGGSFPRCSERSTVTSRPCGSRSTSPGRSMRCRICGW